MQDKIIEKKVKRGIVKFIFFLPLAYFFYKYLKIDNNISKEIELLLSELKENSGVIIEELNIAILKKDGKIKVYSLKCTHLGCIVKFYNDRFICPCHGSEFGSDGEVLKGPALKALKSLNYRIKNNKIYVSLI